MKLDGVFKRQTFLIVGSIVLLLVVFAGISYAFFTKVIKSESDVIVRSGDLQIIFNGSDVISGDFLPISNEDGMAMDGYTFSVSNTGSLNVAYKVEIYSDTSIDGTPIPHEYIMVSFNGEEAKQLSTLTTTATGYSEIENVYLLGNANLAKNNTSDNTIKLWISEDAPLSIIGNKVAFKVKVTSDVVAEQA